jgi:integrase
VGRGECYTRDGYADAIRKAADAAGLKHFTAYLCRHACRMRISRGPGGDEAARAVLGQRHLDVTLRYGAIDLELAREAARKLG